jgi:hypothetical protein
MGDIVFCVLAAAFGGAHLAPLFAPLAYGRAEAKHRHEWHAVALPPTVLEPSAYRSTGPVVVGHLERAPGLVRAAAASSIVFGAMFLPGLAWGLFGLIATGAGLLSIPGLVIAACLWNAGHALLQGTKESAILAARVATAAFYFNVLLLVAALAVAVITHWGEPVRLPCTESAGIALCGFVGGYALLSIGQAVLLGKAASLMGTIHGDPFDGVVENHLPFVFRRLLAKKRERLAAG